MFVRGGSVVHGIYSGGEWCESVYQIEARGETIDELDADVKRLTEEHSSEGSKIDFGYTSGTKVVTWDDEMFEKKQVIHRTEVVQHERIIPRKHTISTQKDSTIKGDKKWIAVCGHTTGYGETEEDAINWVIRKKKGTHIGDIK